ncbi:MAG: hypothetical protein IPM29_04445 [Planctomycetes bacterium]|nr:hypothetical protein [Planctomycetota bacterium]
MKAVVVLFATVALGASSALHLWLFRPFDRAESETIVPLPRPDKEPKEKGDAGVFVMPDAAAAALGRQPPAADAPEEDDGARLGGTPRDDLVVDIDADDEIAMITLADAMRLQLVLVARKPPSVWPVRIDAAGRLTVGERLEHATSWFLRLPERGGDGRRLRYQHWGLLARSLLQVAPDVATDLALALTDDSLDRAAREALRQHCARERIPIGTVQRVTVRPALHDGVPILVVRSVSTT